MCLSKSEIPKFAMFSFEKLVRIVTAMRIVEEFTLSIAFFADSSILAPPEACTLTIHTPKSEADFTDS